MAFLFRTNSKCILRIVHYSTVEIQSRPCSSTAANASLIFRADERCSTTATSSFWVLVFERIWAIQIIEMTTLECRFMYAKPMFLPDRQRESIRFTRTMEPRKFVELRKSVLPPYQNNSNPFHERSFFLAFRKMTNIKKMLRIWMYQCLSILNYLKSSLNVQIFVSVDQILAFFAQIE
jgi:hypothetical protein